MRLSVDNWAMSMAFLCADRATCKRRKVGCVLLNDKRHVIATGFNGVASGLPHCNEGTPCSGAKSASGTNLDGCQAIHAEQNALLQCRDVYDIDTCYCTTAPCVTCVKLLLNTSCKRIVFHDDYAHYEAKLLWLAAGRTWQKINLL